MHSGLYRMCPRDINVRRARRRPLAIEIVRRQHFMRVCRLHLFHTNPFYYSIFVSIASGSASLGVPLAQSLPLLWLVPSPVRAKASIIASCSRRRLWRRFLSSRMSFAIRLRCTLVLSCTLVLPQVTQETSKIANRRSVSVLLRACGHGCVEESMRKQGRGSEELETYIQ